MYTINLPINGVIELQFSAGEFNLRFARGKYTFASSNDGVTYGQAFPIPSVGTGGSGLGGNVQQADLPEYARIVRVA